MSTKHAIRQKLRETLRRLDTDYQAQASIHACRHVIQSSIYQSAAHVALYAKKSSEISPDPLARDAWTHSKALYLPRISSEQLTFHRYTTETPLSNNIYSILEPPADSPTVPVDTPDLIILPLLAFDKTGTRLGQGKAFYDRTLKNSASDSAPFLLGLAYACQEQDNLPKMTHDISLDAIATEEGIYYCKESK